MNRYIKKAYQRYNLEREKRGFPTVSRREFLRMTAIASTSIGIPFIGSCSEENVKELLYDGGSHHPDVNSPVDSGSGLTMGQNSSVAPTVDQRDSIDAGIVTKHSNGFGWATTSETRGERSMDTGTPREAGIPGEGGTFSEDTDLSDVTKTDSLDPIEPQRSQVSIVRDPDIINAVRSAIDMAGGLSEIKGGDRVIIKFNLTTPGTNICTNTEVVRGVIQAIAAHTDPRNITLGECSAFGVSTRVNAIASGHSLLAQQEGISFLAFDDEPYAPFIDPRWEHITDEKMIPQSLNPMSYDHFINVPILKNHDMVPESNVEFTCCMKLFVGLLPFMGAGSRETDNIHTVDLGEKVAELGCCIPTITMNVVDALAPALIRGPTPGIGDTANARLILASKDRVACDALAVAVLKAYAIPRFIRRAYVTTRVWDLATIRRGAELGLGVGDPSMVDIIDSAVDNIADILDQFV